MRKTATRPQPASIDDQRPRRRRTSQIACRGLLVFATVWLGGCSLPASQTAEVAIATPSTAVLLITTEALPSVALDLISTPNLDKLAEHGGQSRQIAASSAIGPALGTLHSGAFWPDASLPDQAVTLAEHLSDRGWHCQAFIAGNEVRGRAGFAQGYESYLPARGWRKALDALRSSRSGTLLWTHLNRPRPPWSGADRSDGTMTSMDVRTLAQLERNDPRQAVAWRLYREAVSGLDTQIGALIEAAETAAREQGHDLLVIFTSAQGIELAELSRNVPQVGDQSFRDEAYGGEAFGVATGLSRNLIEVPLIAAWFNPNEGWGADGKPLPLGPSPSTQGWPPVSASTFLPRVLDTLAAEYGPALQVDSTGSWSRLPWREGDELSWLSPSGEQQRIFPDGRISWSTWRPDGGVVSSSAADESPPEAPFLTPLLPEELSIRAVRSARQPR